ncbi:unknown [Firmicutes bacterium CAG:631]|nr:unknown [Firmicutes bacterium CAG:631]
MKKKIDKYLKSKEKINYHDLDRIFEMYFNGELKKILSIYEGVKIYPSIYQDIKTIQLNYNFKNIYVTIDFFEDKYSVVIYDAETNAEELEKLSTDYAYPKNFNLEQLIKEIDEKIKKHPKLKDTSLIEKKKKTYSLIAWISLCLPILICGSIALYCVITENSIKGNLWLGIFFIVIPLIVWFVFDVKSKRLK